MIVTAKQYHTIIPCIPRKNQYTASSQVSPDVVYVMPSIIAEMAFGNSERIRWKNFWICFAVAIGNVAFGYPSAIVAPTLGKPAFREYMGLGNATGIYAGKESLTGAILGVYQAGGVIGVICSTLITDRWGRKAALLYCSVLSIISFIGLASSVNIGMFITFRFFGGAGGWGFLSVTPVYVSELCPPAHRGFFTGMTGVMLGFGYATASYFGLAFWFSANAAASWRAPLGIGLLWPIIIVCILPFVPESPRYLLMIGNEEKACDVILKLHNDPQDPDQSFARREFYQMQQQATHDRSVPSNWMDMWKKKSYRKRAIAGMIFTFLTQSTAVLVINNYGPTFYADLGFNTRDQLILQSGRDSIAFLGNIVGALLVDRFGRRTLILVGQGGCIVCLCIEAAMVALYSKEGTNKTGLGVGVCALFVYLVFYAAGIDAAGLVWLAEIFPNFIRAKGLALAIMMYAMSDIVYLQVTPLAFATIGWKFFLVFITVSAVGFVWLFFNIVETTGIPLEEIAASFGDGDEIVVYARDLEVGHTTHELVVHKHAGTGEGIFEELNGTPKASIHEKENA